MIILYSVLTIGLMGLFSGVMLSYAAKRFSVPIDPRVEKLAGILPGANCGACGYASCVELAKAMLKGEVGSDGCVAGGYEIANKAAEFTGKPVSSKIIVSMTAVVQCRGGRALAKERFRYIGIEDCSAAILIAGGPKACIYGCLGLGSCVKVCPFSAIAMGQDGIPLINGDKCTGCGKCVEVCPREIIKLIPRAQDVYLACVSNDKAKKKIEVCKAGCIVCGICVKPDVTAKGLVTMGENLPQIHWKEGLNLKAAVDKCPKKCFVVRG